MSNESGKTEYYQCEVCGNTEPKDKINFLEYYEMCAEVACDDCVNTARGYE